MQICRLDKHVREMKALALQLVPHSFPIKSPQDEEIISCLKQREIVVDGYDLLVYFNRCRYLDIELESLQVFGKYHTFLPFSLVCKVATQFLDDKELSFIEVMHNRKGVADEFARKIYVWTVYYKDNDPVPSPFITKFTPCVYEGLRYSHVDRNQIAFF